MTKYGKWVGGGLGWVLGGPIGGIVGFVVGSLFDFSDEETGPTTGHSSRPGDFAISLVILAGAVMKSNDQRLKVELEYIKEFFKRNYGVEKTRELMIILRETIDQPYSLRDVCLQIKGHMSHPGRLQLVHFLVGIAQADGEIDQRELDMLKLIAGYLGINPNDFESVKAMYVDEIDGAYKILEVEQHATDDEVRKAFRKMAAKYHPDKVAHLGEEVVKGAEEKFQQLTAAFDRIKKQRGIK